MRCLLSSVHRVLQHGVGDGRNDDDHEHVVQGFHIGVGGGQLAGGRRERREREEGERGGGERRAVEQQ